MDRLDDADRIILRVLQQDGRVSMTDLAQQVEMSPPTVQRRIKSLEEAGYIKTYTAVLDPLKFGLTVTAFIFIETSSGCDIEELRDWLMVAPGVQEVHNLIGEWCFMLKVRTASPQTLEDTVYRYLRRNPQVRRTQTVLATSSPFETTRVPITE